MANDASRIALDLYEDLRFGFRLDSEGLRDESRRFAGSPAAGEAMDSALFAGRDARLQPVASRVAASFARGAALELSGGVDSRFVLALGLAAGEAPRRALTIDTGGADAEIAAEIARTLRIEHRVVRFDQRPSPGTLRADAVAFVQASLGRANATASAYFPGVFRQVADFRDEQVGGVGGEVAAGFYHTPIDALWRGLPLSLWVRLRLAAPGDRQVGIFEPSRRRALAEASMGRLRAALELDGRPDGTWRARVDRLYREYRLGNWAAATLEASSHWYRVTMPLMSDAYFDWARSVPAAEHRGKSVQRAFVQRVLVQRVLEGRGSERRDPVVPDGQALGSVPYAVASDTAGRRSRGAKIMRKWRRVVERLGSRPRPAPRLASDAATVLSGDPEFRESILALARWESGALGLESDGLRRMLEAPGLHALELGALATTAVRLGLLRAD
jgi:hypothetical protein